MKKNTFLLSFLFIALVMSAQALVRINFEDNTVNSAAASYNGSVSVIANPTTTGINSSAYCLDVVNNGYAPVKFPTFTLSSGTAASYPYWKLKFKVAYKAYNGANTTAGDNSYPSVDVYSQPSTSAFSDIADYKLGSINSVWSVPSASGDSLVWKYAELTFSASSLTTIPAGYLYLKLAKSKCEYLLDDIELVPSLTYGSDFTVLNDFESSTLNDATTYPVANIYSGAVGASNSSVVAANPASTAAKTTLPLGNTGAQSLLLTYNTASAYNNVASINVSISGNVSDYDFLYYDRYFASTSYNQLWVKLGSNKLFQENANKYPSIASGWYTEVFGIPASATGSGTVSLQLGYTNMTAGSVYFDNIRIHKKSTGGTTGLTSASQTALIIVSDGKSFKLSQTVDKVELFDISGHKLNTLINVNEVPALNLSNGVYVLRSVLNGESFVFKIVK